MLKREKLFSGVLFFIAVLVFCGGFCFYRGRKQRSLRYAGKGDLQTDGLRTDFIGAKVYEAGSDANYVEGEVVCSADSEEEAMRLAESVNGKLKSWQNGIGIITIEETVSEFLKKYSVDPDFSNIYPNYIYYTQ